MWFLINSMPSLPIPPSSWRNLTQRQDKMYKMLLSYQTDVIASMISTADTFATKVRLRNIIKNTSKINRLCLVNRTPALVPVDL